MALRLPPLVLATVTVAVPGPEPELLTAPHEVNEDADHAQPAAVDTETVADPPSDVKLSDVGVTT